MKNLFQVLIFMSCVVSFGALSGSVSERIGWIKREYSETRENLNQYKKIEYGFSGESAEGEGGYGYIAEHGEIRCIEVTYYGETGKASYEFYFSNGSPYFILEQHYEYNAPMYLTEEMANEWREEDGMETEAFDPGKTKLEEWRFYFDGESLIRILNPQKVEVKDPGKGKDVYADALENLKRLKDEINRRKADSVNAVMPINGD